MTKVRKIYLVLSVIYYLVKLIISLLSTYLSIKIRFYFWKKFSRRYFRKMLRKNNLPPDLCKRLENEYSKYLVYFSRSMKPNIIPIGRFTDTYRGRYRRKY